MRIAYFDCFAGASGDMILAALFDVGLEPHALVEGLAALGLKGAEVKVTEVARHGVRAKTFAFTATGGPKGGSFKDIAAALEAASLAPSIKARAIRAFDILAEAEGRVHGRPKADVHFHEVGSLDAMVDVVGASIGLDALGIEQVVASPLALGGGTVHCEHGTLPSPAPATVEIARGLPVRGWAVNGELTTPTGAAILKASAAAFGPVPEMTVTAVGYGAGTRDLPELPNVMRLIVGESAGEPAAGALVAPGALATAAALTSGGLGRSSDRVTLLEANIDDMNPQVFSHIYEDLFAQGALDVWVQAILMKKGRPGFLLSILAEAPRVPAIADLVFRETTTSGIRLRDVVRVKLPRRFLEVETRFGRIKVKVFGLGESERCAPEYDDCLRCARAHDVAVREVMEETRHVFRQMPRGAE